MDGGGEGGLSGSQADLGSKLARNPNLVVAESLQHALEPVKLEAGGFAIVVVEGLLDANGVDVRLGKENTRREEEEEEEGGRGGGDKEGKERGWV